MKTANAMLAALLSPADLELLAQCLESVMEHRFGEVHLVIEQGMVKFIRPEFSYSTTRETACGAAQQTAPQRAQQADQKALEAE